jgi:hypothetical protein
MSLRDAALPSDLMLPNMNVEPVVRFENPHPDKQVPPQAVNTAPFSYLIRKYFPLRIGLSGCTQSEPNRVVFCLNQRSRKNLALRLLQVDFDLVLRRPIETAGLLGTWLLWTRSQGVVAALWRSETLDGIAVK